MKIPSHFSACEGRHEVFYGANLLVSSDSQSVKGLKVVKTCVPERRTHSSKIHLFLHISKTPTKRHGVGGKSACPNRERGRDLHFESDVFTHTSQLFGGKVTSWKAPKFRRPLKRKKKVLIPWCPEKNDPNSHGTCADRVKTWLKAARELWACRSNPMGLVFQDFPGRRKRSVFIAPIISSALFNAARPHFVLGLRYSDRNWDAKIGIVERGKGGK